ncbi:MAG: [LysW]-lysine hydrolase [Anaerolineae bacterium]|nr:[LysW]-lysine hydrolase [Anaerolineae bacterium]
MSQLLTDLVSIYSPSGEEQDAVARLSDWMAAHGFDAHVDAAGNAVGERAGEAPEGAPLKTLILLGHIDTYPGHITTRVEDDVLYGRGSVDAKGSLCAFAEAAAAASIPAGWRVVVAGAVEEESATSKGARQIAASYQPDLCIIGEPSGAGRITLGYKGRLLVDATLKRANAHTARPEPSAVELAVDFWQAVKAWANAQNEGITRYFDQIMPSLRRVRSGDDPFIETVEMTLGFRLPPAWMPDAVLDAITAFAPQGMELRDYGPERAHQSHRGSPLVRSLAAAIRANGDDPGYVLKTGTSDMNVVGAVWDCPIVAYGPGDSNLDHTPDEHLPLVEYRRAVQVLRTLIESLPSDG